MSKKWKQLNQNNNAYERQITPENNEIYTQILIYLRGSHIPEYDQECVRQDLITMILNAQERGESLDTIIGEDYKQFCDEIIATFKPNKTKQFLNFLGILFHSFFFLGLIQIITSSKTIPLIEKTVNEKAFDFHYTIPISVATLSMFLLITSFSFFIVYFITKNAFKNKRFVIILGSIFAGATLVLVFITHYFLETIVLFHLNFLVACLIVIVFYVLHRIFDKF